jgi:hypothetical protein
MADRQTPAELKAAAKVNMQRLCETDGCYLKRSSGFGKLCITCRERKKKYGTVTPPPDSTRRKKVYSSEVKLVTKLLSANPHHPAIKAAQKVVKQWLYESQCADTGMGIDDQFKVYVPARLPMRVLADNNVDPLSIVIMTAACWLYIRRRPDKYDGHTAITQALGYACLRSNGWSAKADGRINKKDASQAGQYLFQNLSKLYVHVEHILIEKGNRERELKAALQEALPADLELTPTERRWVNYRKDAILNELGLSEHQPTNTVLLRVVTTTHISTRAN